ncbi:hypothetical protein ACFV2V_00070 [Streptomyces sp. NPDC059698]|uniref:hypothetical protein n=1 Tax=unclassified Streptomyces TaxID=2593676 RepID=UPI00093FD37E|nr:hypothetical protein [Streptomyces sp. CB02366]OKJ32146.1 hypothetical protein AMK24_27485 [Streptomyces sp. CB02366]TVP37481.1 hypothetical protein A3L22_27195 [Streptomyces griseus subsp. griseus]WSS59187.1 hypothetical protein OG543_29265 [Streptomyces sp. NBC_01178]
MRCRETSAFQAVLSVLLMVSALALGSFAQTPQPAGATAHPPAVSVFDTSGPSMPLEGVDGDATLQQRHKAGNTTASSPVQAGAPSSSPELHDCASDVVRQHASPPGSRSPVQVRILRC